MIDWLQTHLGMSPQLQTRLLVTAGTIVGLWLLRHFVLGFVYRRGGWRRGPARPGRERGPGPVSPGGGPSAPTTRRSGPPPPAPPRPAAPAGAAPATQAH